MKCYKIFSLITISFLPVVLSCNSNDTNTAHSAGNSNETDGLVIMKKYDCPTCHNATSKIVGPSFKDIAAKYANTADNVALLATKVINGGSGVWGNIPMAAHPTLPRQDAEKIVGYILSTGGGK
jgi:cytochrome c